RRRTRRRPPRRLAGGGRMGDGARRVDGARARREGHRPSGAIGGGVKGKWAQGISPRNFAWVIKDRLAVSERPGGYARTHGRVRGVLAGYLVYAALVPSPAEAISIVERITQRQMGPPGRELVAVAATLGS